ncbi:MAG: DegT/DnrJ/EryC1/StrS family aminotransferase [Cytophagales bacterium]|nr:DegT/DnrJ/EryC1/StrS family aminotransferase [Cytophagales bacterium]
MINVTKPFLPPYQEYEKLVEGIWKRNWLTNNGPLVNDLEIKLKDYLNLDHLSYVSNGTIALQIAIKALDLKGEIITTPFSYVATTSSIVWENCTPIFVDIDPLSFNINHKLIEQAITKKTSAILATHVYGNPCAIDEIEAIAKKHQLKVIYDAAHCFGTTYKGESVLKFGDISTISFHATKLYHTTEGGAIITTDPKILKSITYLRNFGHVDSETFSGIGINGKNSEFHAAMGVCNLKYADHILEKRKEDHKRYDECLNQLELQKPLIAQKAGYNHAYYPIVFNSEQDCINVSNELNKNLIYARRYFYPILSNLDYVNSSPMPIAEDISKRILCLPLYEQITPEEIDMICRIILRTLRY